MKAHPKGKDLPDDVSKYKSPSTGEYVMAHQYIAEIMVARKAAKENKDLAYKYWNEQNDWAKEFRSQVGTAAKLLKKHPSSVIIKAIFNIKWCYSLRTKKLLEEIDKQQKIFEHNQTKIDIPQDVIEKPKNIGVNNTNITFLGRLKKLQE